MASEPSASVAPEEGKDAELGGALILPDSPTPQNNQENDQSEPAGKFLPPTVRTKTNASAGIVSRADPDGESPGDDVETPKDEATPSFARGSESENEPTPGWAVTPVADRGVDWEMDPNLQTADVSSRTEATGLTEEEWAIILESAVLERTVGQWDQFVYSMDGAANMRFYMHQETQVATWEKPLEVLEADETVEADKALLARANPFAFENLDFEEDMDKAWVPPSIDRAAKAREEALFQRGNASLLTTTSDALLPLGTGVSLYFRLLRYLALLFLWLSLLSIPALLIYGNGRRIPGAAADATAFARLSLGNAGDLSQLSTSESDIFGDGIVEPKGNETFVTIGDSNMTGYEASYTAAYLDFVGTLCFAAFIWFFGRRILVISSAAERRHIRTRDYTVFVRGLPRDVTMEEVRDFFSERFGLEEFATWAEEAADADVDFTDPAVRAARATNILSQERAANMQRAKSRMSAVVALRRSSTSKTTTTQSTSKGTSTAKHSGIVGFSASFRRNIGGMDVRKLAVYSQAGTGGVALESVEEDDDDANNEKNTDQETTTTTTTTATKKQPPRTSSTKSSKTPKTTRNRRGSTGVVRVLHTTKPNVDPKTGRPTATAHPEYGDGGGARQFDFPEEDAPMPAPSAVDVAAVAKKLATPGPARIDTSKDLGEVSAVGVRPVLDVTHNNNKAFIGSWVADVSLARAEGRRLRAFLAVRDVLRKLRRARARYKMALESTPLRRGPSEAERAKAEAEVTKLQFRLEEVKHRLGMQNVIAELKEEEKERKKGKKGKKHEKHHHHKKRSRSSKKSSRNSAFVPDYEDDGAVAPKDDDEDDDEEEEEEEEKDEDELRRMELERIEAEIEAKSREVVGAFVTFNHEESFVRCVNAYSWSQHWWGRLLLQGPQLRFRGEHRLNVTQAPDPSDVLFENLDTPQNERFLRRCFTSLATVVLMLGSFAIILAANASVKSYVDSIPDLAICESNLPAAFFGSFSNSSLALNRLQQAAGGELETSGTAGQLNDKQRVESLAFGLPLERYPFDSKERESLDDQCGSRRAYIGYIAPALSELVSYDVTVCTSNDGTEACPRYRETQCPCVSPSSSGRCQTLPCFDPSLETAANPCTTFPASSIAGCYCIQRLQQLVDEEGSSAGTQRFIDEESDACGEFAAAYASAQSISLLAALVTSIVNVALSWAIPRLVLLEHHSSVSRQTLAHVVKATAAQVINTGIIPLIVLMRLPPAFRVPFLEQIGIFGGDTVDFVFDWYSTAGTLITTTMLFNIFLPHAIPLGKFFLTECRRRCCYTAWTIEQFGTVRTQEELNRTWMGETFSLDDRIPNLLTNLFVAAAFSSGMPFLNVLAFIAFGVDFAVTRLLLLRFYRKPPAYDGSLATYVLGTLPWALLLHCGFAIFMFGRPDLLPSEMLPALEDSLRRAAETSAGGNGTMTATTSSDGSLFDAWVTYAQGVDAYGFVGRIARVNAFPFFLLAVIIIVYLLFRSLVLEVVAQILTVCGLENTCGCGAAAIRGDRRKWAAPFTAPFGKVLDASLTNDVTCLREVGLSTSKVAREKESRRELGRVEVSQGWRVEDVGGVSILRKVTTAAVPDDSPDIQAILQEKKKGKKHRALRLKRTWEVVADTGQFSYAPFENQKYRDALLAAGYGPAAEAARRVKINRERERRASQIRRNAIQDEKLRAWMETYDHQSHFTDVAPDEEYGVHDPDMGAGAAAYEENAVGVEQGGFMGVEQGGILGGDFMGGEPVDEGGEQAPQHDSGYDGVYDASAQAAAYDESAQGYYDESGQMAYDASGQAVYDESGQAEYDASGHAAYDENGEAAYDESAQEYYDESGQAVYDASGQAAAYDESAQGYYDESGQAEYDASAQGYYDESGQAQYNQGDEVQYDESAYPEGEYTQEPKYAEDET